MGTGNADLDNALALQAQQLKQEVTFKSFELPLQQALQEFQQIKP